MNHFVKRHTSPSMTVHHKCDFQNFRFQYGCLENHLKCYFHSLYQMYSNVCILLSHYLIIILKQRIGILVVEKAITRIFTLVIVLSKYAYASLYQIGLQFLLASGEGKAELKILIGLRMYLTVSLFKCDDDSEAFDCNPEMCFWVQHTAVELYN